MILVLHSQCLAKQTLNTRLTTVIRLIIRLLPWLFLPPVLSSLPLAAQEDAVLSAMHLTGASSVEELDESEMERFSDLARHPLKINLLSRSRLLASGLFSSYQVASLLDYRARSADVLSVSELELVDGFASDARWLAPFLDFSTSTLPGRRRDSLRLENDMLLRLSVRKGESAAAMKYSVAAGDRADGSLVLRKTYSDPLWPPARPSVSAGYYGRNVLTKLVAGDLNARFGQGLVMWSGFTMSGFSSARSFAKHPSGLSVCRSFSPQLTGAGAEFSFGRTSVSSLVSLDGIVAANASYYGRRGQLGMSAAISCNEKSRGATVSADTRFSVGKTDLFGELAYGSGGMAALAGATHNPAYGCRISLLGRYYPHAYFAPMAAAARSSTKSEDELGAAVGIDWNNLSFSFDYARHPYKGKTQMKAILNYQQRFSGRISSTLRSSFRYRPEDKSQIRVDFRLDTDYTLSDMSFRFRANLLRCHSWSWLSYAEAGYKNAFTAYIRATLFQVDDWDDRIYVYERDVPYSFSSSAVYGRGYSFSIFAGYKLRRVGFYLRASAVRYHKTSTAGRDSTAELKTQMLLSF